MTLAAGTYGSSLLASVGVANVFADATTRYPTVTLDDVRARRPDVVLAPSEPYPFAERHVPLFDEVAPVVLVDGQDLFWWGVRTAGARARLAAQLGRRRPPGVTVRSSTATPRPPAGPARRPACSAGSSAGTARSRIRRTRPP